MSEIKDFFRLFIKRSFQPIKPICVFIYKLIPISFRKKIRSSNLLFTIYYLLFTVMLISYFLPRNRIIQSQLAVSRWPLSVNNHLQIAQTYFNNNDLKNAKSELETAKNYYQYLKFLDIFGKTKQKIYEVNELITTPDKIQQQINHLEEFLQNNPDVRDIHLQLSLLYYQLKNNEQAKKNWERAFYLDPNNSSVQEIGRIINQ